MATKISVVDAREFGTHDSHCFRWDEYEQEYLGCKYGPDEECPTKRLFQDFRVHFEQVNQMWIDISARDKDQAIHYAQEQAKEWVPVPDVIEMPNGEQLELDLA